MPSNPSTGMGVYLIGDAGDGTRRPTGIVLTARESADTCLEQFHRDMRLGALKYRAVQLWYKGVEREGISLEAWEVGRVPIRCQQDGAEFHARVLVDDGWRILNTDVDRLLFPEQSSPAGEPEASDMYIVAAWDVETERCRKVGSTGKAPYKWLHNCIYYAAQEVFAASEERAGRRLPNPRRPLRLTPTTEWLASFDGAKADSAGYPRVSVLTTVPRDSADVLQRNRQAKKRADDTVAADVRRWKKRLHVEDA